MKDQVKNLEIYRMPDGKNYFAARGQKNTYFLYPVENCTEPPVYEITNEGQIKHWQTNEKCYSLSEMQDTGLKFDCAKNEPFESSKSEDQPKQPFFLIMLGDFYYGGKNNSY